MKINRLLSVVPRNVRIGAALFAGCAPLAGLILGSFERTLDHLPSDPTATLLAMGIGVGAGLFIGSLFAIWLLCVGFVYGDAKLRAMRPALWVWIVILFPHLLGFLLYFVLRQPITSTCPHCGQKIPQTLRFCSWCGNPQTPSAPGGPASGPGSANLNIAGAI